jgi:hypothetical protein
MILLQELHVLSTLATEFGGSAWRLSATTIRTPEWFLPQSSRGGLGGNKETSVQIRVRQFCFEMFFVSKRNGFH